LRSSVPIQLQATVSPEICTAGSLGFSTHACGHALHQATRGSSGNFRSWTRSDLPAWATNYEPSPHSFCSLVPYLFGVLLDHVRPFLTGLTTQVCRFTSFSRCRHLLRSFLELPLLRCSPAILARLYTQHVLLVQLALHSLMKRR
jgi:hypothetical protein